LNCKRGKKGKNHFKLSAPGGQQKFAKQKSKGKDGTIRVPRGKPRNTGKKSGRWVFGKKGNTTRTIHMMEIKKKRVRSVSSRRGTIDNKQNVEILDLHQKTRIGLRVPTIRKKSNTKTRRIVTKPW